MHGTIDYLSLCNKTSVFIHGVRFMLSIWMCKKIHKNKCVWQCVCVCVAVMRCARDAESTESVCDVHQTELLTVRSSAKKIKKIPKAVLGICRCKRFSSDIINRTADEFTVHCRNLVLNITFFFRLFPLVVFNYTIIWTLLPPNGHAWFFCTPFFFLKKGGEKCKM